MGSKERAVKRLPKFLKHYFWEVDFETLDADRYSRYVIERILEYGGIKAVKWMTSTFSPKEIKSVLFTTRGLSLRSATFWAVVLGVSKERVQCLNKPYLEIRKKFWPY
jgi:hypothetical protein